MPDRPGIRRAADAADAEISAQRLRCRRLRCAASRYKGVARAERPPQGGKSLLSMNQPDGFDCPGCAWPDPKHASSFEFCENGAKAISFELTRRRVSAGFFAA